MPPRTRLPNGHRVSGVFQQRQDAEPTAAQAPAAGVAPAQTHSAARRAWLSAYETSSCRLGTCKDPSPGGGSTRSWTSSTSRLRRRGISKPPPSARCSRLPAPAVSGLLLVLRLRSELQSLGLHSEA